MKISAGFTTDMNRYMASERKNPLDETSAARIQVGGQDASRALSIKTGDTVGISQEARTMLEKAEKGDTALEDKLFGQKRNTIQSTGNGSGDTEDVKSELDELREQLQQAQQELTEAQAELAETQDKAADGDEAAQAATSLESSAAAEKVATAAAKVQELMAQMMELMKSEA